MAFQQIPESAHRWRGTAHPASEWLQDIQSDIAGANPARGTGAVAARLRLDAVLRRGRRPRADASGHGRDSRSGGGTDQDDSAGGARQPTCGWDVHAAALADDSPQIPQGMDGT